MIIGNGLIAKTINELNHDDLIFFASGVSNSKTLDVNEFIREKDLLVKTIKENNFKKIIYFSTCDMYDSSKQDSLYLKHKLNMEDIVKNNSKHWIIFRISQIIGIGNKNNLLYKLCSNINDNKKFQLYYNYERNLIDINNLKKIIKHYLSSQDEIINIANPINIKVGKIIEIIENTTNKKGLYDIDLNDNSFKILLNAIFPYELFNHDYYNEKISSFVLTLNK